MQYTGLFTPSSSRIRAELTAAEETARYRYSSSPVTARDNLGGELEIFLQFDECLLTLRGPLKGFPEHSKERKASISGTRDQPIQSSHLPC